MSQRRRRRSQSAEVDPARLAAYTLLREVAETGAYANLVLPKILRDRSISGTDAAFATELAYGTLRLRGRYDAIIDQCASRDLSEIDERALDVLRLGCHQILGMRVPDYAAVSSSAALVRRVGRSSAAGFVNAILRRVAATDLTDWLASISPTVEQNRDEHLFAVTSHPRWIGLALKEALASDGQEDELADLLAANNSVAPVTLVARPGRISATRLQEQTEGELGRLSPWAVRIHGDPGRFPAVRDGDAGVQDEGSQLMPLALTRAEVNCADDRWLDMCAGPGGKAADLAGLAQEVGAELTVVEQHPHRAELVRAALGPESQVRVVTGDVRELPTAGGFSRILLDAPCTGLGALRRRPDLRWRRSTADLPALRRLQQELLETALALLRPGGVVGYATCSPHLAETDEIVETVLADRVDIERLNTSELVPEVENAQSGDALRLWPHRHDTDGMYLALLRRAVGSANEPATEPVDG